MSGLYESESDEDDENMGLDETDNESESSVNAVLELPVPRAGNAKFVASQLRP